MSGIAGIGKGILGLSDEEAKENIMQLGISNSGIPIYSFNYKGDDRSWSGAMAQDLIKLNKTDAVCVMENGYYGVMYDKIDVDMLELNKAI